MTSLTIPPAYGRHEKIKIKIKKRKKKMIASKNLKWPKHNQKTNKQTNQ